MTTIIDVANYSGVSIATVSNVINHPDKVAPDTVAKVKAAIKHLNYIPNNMAKGLKQNINKTIGILAEDINAFFSTGIIDGICHYAENHGYLISLCNLRINCKVRGVSNEYYKELENSDAFQKSVSESLKSLLASRICGLIYIGVHPRDVSGILPALGIPVVYAYCYTNSDDYCVNYDDFQGAKLAVDYLISQNHTKIGLICGTVDSVPTHKRMMGYQTALMEHDIPLHPDYLRFGDWNHQNGYSKCMELLKLPDPPTAIFAMSDTIAYGAIRAMVVSGLHIPDDISVHGFDNIDFSSYFFPSLTTVELPLHELGKEAARTTILLIEGKDPGERNKLLPCIHIIRETVKPPHTQMTVL